MFNVLKCCRIWWRIVKKKKHTCRENIARITRSTPILIPGALLYWYHVHEILGNGIKWYSYPVYLPIAEVAWPSGLRRWFKAPVSSGAWVRIPPLPDILPINFVQVPNSSTYFIEKWPFLEGSCQNFWHWEGKYAGCWGCGGEMYEQWKKFQGTHGFEPWTYRTAADCSTTELYPLSAMLSKMWKAGRSVWSVKCRVL